jgi:flagellar motor protein MotB
LNIMAIYPRRLAVTAALTALAAVTVTALSGCSMGGSPHSTTGNDPTSLGQLDTSHRTPVVALIWEASEPMTTGNTAALRTVLHGAETERADLLLIGVNGSSYPQNEMVATQLVGTGVNPHFASQNLDAKTAKIEQQIRILSHEPSHSRLDVVAGVRAVNQDLIGLHPSRIDVVVLGNAAQTTDPKLTSSAILSNPAASINQLSAKGLLFPCTNYHLYLIGNNTDNGHSLSDTTNIQLGTWWDKWINLCGGRLVDFGSAISAFPLSENISGPDYAAIHITPTPSGGFTASVRSDALFATGSSQLNPRAEGTLAVLVPLIARISKTIYITGYTDNQPDPAPGGNHALSIARAQSVTTYLIQRTGLPASRFHTAGAGSAHPTATNSTPQGRAQNCRVTITSG